MIKKIVIAVAVLCILLISGFFLIKKGGFEQVSYETTPITKGTISRTISSTGTLNPVSTVQVGTQVSGTIVKVNVDYNSVVKKGQVIAEIDKEPLQSKLGQVQAAYTKAQAMLEQAKSTFERNEPLYKKGLISDDDYLTYKTNYLTQKANVDGAKADVDNALTNLKYAIIKSPINGTVIQRSIDVGQTVAASLSAPTLFIIAEDLRKMQILADVDESDIGKIKTGQTVTFSVSAYPDKTYNGVVDQIRLQPETVQNVVTYSVVIKAANEDGLLLPGMTANVDFIAEQEDDALLIPSAALRFKPSEDIINKMQKEREQRQKARESSGQSDRSSKGFDSSNGMKMGMGMGGMGMGKHGFGNRGIIWTLTDNNEVRPMFVHIGISDGQFTSVTGRNIEEGIKVITGIVDKKSDKKQAKTHSLFAPPSPSKGNNNGNNRRPMGPGGF